MTLEEFEKTLTQMSIRSRAFALVKQEMIKRGHWKYADRGAKPPKMRQFSRVSIHPSHAHQISVNDSNYWEE